MRFQIKHEIEGRLRVHMMQNRMTFAEADTLQYYLEGLPGVAHAKVYEKTCDAVVTYTAERADIITALKQFCYDRVELPTAISGHSSRSFPGMCNNLPLPANQSCSSSSKNCMIFSAATESPEITGLS